jgi:cell division initiation protein
MRVTPTDIRQQSFTVRLFRGFDLQEVDAFLEDVAEDLEFAIKENTTLREQLAAMEERMRAVGEREKILQETLVATQRVTEEMKEAAKREAGLHLREAELQGEKIVESARSEEARILNDVQMLKRTRRQLVEEIRSTLETYQRWLSEFSGESGDATPKP